MLKDRVEGIKKRILNFKRNESAPKWLDLFADQDEKSNNADYRINMTVSCRDSDYIPKVKNAGLYKTIDNKEYQVMHNGILVESGGYFGDWMSKIITNLKGHHEPQEEKIFHEILSYLPNNATMIELGSYWSYYSIWFNRNIKNATNYCCEPDEENLKLGKRNAEINKTQNMNFILSAAGKDDGKIISFQPQEDETREALDVPIRSIDGLLNDLNIKQIDIVHMDVQGEELNALEGAENAIRSGKIRFILVSTHHFTISKDPRIHEKCLEYIKERGGHIIAEHAIHESFSGDGLIAASFSKKDRNLKIDISINRMENSLFQSYTKDLNILIKAYQKYI